jgi:hypothetical protein
MCTTLSFSIHCEGTLAWFHILATVSRAVINMGVSADVYSDTGFIFFGQMLSSTTAGWCGISVFNILRNLHVVFYSDWTPSIYKGSLFSTCSPALTFHLFHTRYSGEWKIIFHCGFKFHFPDDWWFFSYAPWPFMCLLLRNDYSDSWPIFKSGFFFAIELVVGLPSIFCILRCMTCKYFLPFLGLSLHCADWFLCWAETF